MPYKSKIVGTLWYLWLKKVEINFLILTTVVFLLLIYCCESITDIVFLTFFEGATAIRSEASEADKRSIIAHLYTLVS